MRNAHELLIVALANVDLLLPVGIFANDECAYSFRNKQIDDASACCMQIVVYPTSALVRDASREAGIFSCGRSRLTSYTYDSIHGYSS